MPGFIGKLSPDLKFSSQEQFAPIWKTFSEGAVTEPKSEVTKEILISFPSLQVFFANKRGQKSLQFKQIAIFLIQWLPLLRLVLILIVAKDLVRCKFGPINKSTIFHEPLICLKHPNISNISLSNLPDFSPSATILVQMSISGSLI